MAKVISFEEEKYRRIAGDDYNTYIDKESGDEITDPKVCLALSKLDRLYIEYQKLAEKSSAIMKKFNIS